jgi:sulfatase maturation enzyme AslB (radical SAM superfamily)
VNHLGASVSTDRPQTQCANGIQQVRRSMKVRVGPAGIHAFDRVTGLNLLIDEARAPSSCWAAAPRSVSIALTNACDLHCPYCYAPKKPATLDLGKLCGWLCDLDSTGCLGVGFGGGEPTLCGHLPSLCQFVAHSTRMAVTFTTHGHRLDSELAAALRGSVHFIRVSMDGVGPTYSALRGRSFDALMTKIAIVRDLCPFGINFVVNAQTVNDLDRAIEVADQFSASEVLLLPEQAVNGRPGIDEATAERLHGWVDRYTGPVRLTVSTGGSDGLPTCDPLLEEVGLRAYAHIDAAGVLKRSSYEDTGVEIGHGSILDALARLQSGGLAP